MDQETQLPSNNNLKLVAIIGLIIFVGAGGFTTGQLFATRQKNIDNKKTFDQTQDRQVSPSPIIQEEVAEPTKSAFGPEWIRTNTLGIVSFQYPFSWHVAVLWPETNVKGINIAIDKEPINTAPRGGSLDDLNINVLNGIPDPEEKLQERINGFKNGLQELEETEIEGLSGKIKFIKGKTIFFGESQSVEGYFFLIPSSDQNDKINYQIISTSIGSDSIKAPYLEQIIKSFKREY